MSATPHETAGDVRARRRLLIGGAVALPAGLFGVSALAGHASTGTSVDEAATSTVEVPSAVDVGFLTDMTQHHLQALAMCERVLGHATGDAVQAAATEVLRNQAIEVGTMRAWLTDWGQSTSTPSTVMGWMGMHDGAGMPLATMPGLASDAEMTALAVAQGRDRGRMWLELMREHHVGGVAMATAATEIATAQKVLRLARIQAEVQTFEIAQYDQLLATEYA